MNACKLDSPWILPVDCGRSRILKLASSITPMSMDQRIEAWLNRGHDGPAGRVEARPRVTHNSGAIAPRPIRVIVNESMTLVALLAPHTRQGCSALRTRSLASQGVWPHRSLKSLVTRLGLEPRTQRLRVSCS